MNEPVFREVSVHAGDFQVILRTNDPTENLDNLTNRVIGLLLGVSTDEIKSLYVKQMKKDLEE